MLSPSGKLTRLTVKRTIQQLLRGSVFARSCLAVRWSQTPCLWNAPPNAARARRQHAAHRSLPPRESRGFLPWDYRALVPDALSSQRSVPGRCRSAPAGLACGRAPEVSDLTPSVFSRCMGSIDHYLRFAPPPPPIGSVLCHGPDPGALTLQWQPPTSMVSNAGRGYPGQVPGRRAGSVRPARPRSLRSSEPAAWYRARGPRRSLRPIGGLGPRSIQHRKARCTELSLPNSRGRTFHMAVGTGDSFSQEIRYVPDRWQRFASSSSSGHFFRPFAVALEETLRAICRMRDI